MFDLTPGQVEKNQQEWLNSLDADERERVKDIIATNNALVGYEPDWTHQVASVDNQMQNDGVRVPGIPSEYIK